MGTKPQENQPHRVGTDQNGSRVSPAQQHFLGDSCLPSHVIVVRSHSTLRVGVYAHAHMQTPHATCHTHVLTHTCTHRTHMHVYSHTHMHHTHSHTRTCTHMHMYTVLLTRAQSATRRSGEDVGLRGWRQINTQTALGVSLRMHPVRRGLDHFPPPVRRQRGTVPWLHGPRPVPRPQ